MLRRNDSQLELLLMPVGERRIVRAHCTQCGCEIANTHQPGDIVVSEYRDAQGRCWDCAQPKTRKEQ